MVVKRCSIHRTAIMNDTIDKIYTVAYTRRVGKPRKRTFPSYGRARLSKVNLKAEDIEIIPRKLKKHELYCERCKRITQSQAECESCGRDYSIYGVYLSERFLE